MTVRINLLPESYRQHRRRSTRFRIMMIGGVALLAAELCVGLTLHLRTAKTRELLDEAQKTNDAAETANKRLTVPAREAARLGEQVTLATELRTTHYWSRLLAMLGDATPDRVILAGIATDPPRWSKVREKVPERGSGPKTDKSAEAKPLIKGIVINGFAVDHDDLAKFMSALQAAEAFASIDLKDFRRDTVLSQEAVAFELRCQW
jgi:Tfp pilus assembly protein PilN